MLDMEEKFSRASTDAEKQEAAAVKEAPSLPGQQIPEPSADATSPVPKMPTFAEGGKDGWLAVTGAWCVMAISFGIMNAFGVYESYYLAGPLRDETASNIAWIGSINIFFLFASAIVSGPLVDRIGPNYIIGPSSLGIVLSQMLTSLCKEYYQFILCQGVFGGIATGFLYSPAAAVVGHYFHRKRPLAMGIITSGSAVGGIIYPVILDRMLNHSDVGFGWAQRTVAFICLLMGIVATVTIKPGVPPRKGTYLLLGAFKNMAYTLQVVGLFFFCWGMFTPFFFLPAYAQAHGMSTSLSFYLVTFLNAGSIFGRLIAGAFGILAGQFNVLASCCLISSIMVWSWLSVESNASVIVFSVFYGAFSGGAISTMIATLAACAPAPNQMGTYIGMASFVLGIAGLTGTPINGAFLTHYGEFKEAIYFSGVCVTFGSIVLVGARLAFAPISQWRA